MTRRGGAVLCLPVDAQRQDTRAKGDFGKWMIKNIDTWFAFARSLGLGIEQMEEIVLVTGMHLTRSWANVAFFEGQTNGQASLGVEVAYGGIKWQCSPGSVRGGVRSWGPGGKVCQSLARKHWHPFLCIFQGLLENQCVFIRGYRVTRVFGILPRRLRAAAGPNPSLDDDDESDKELISLYSAKKVTYSYPGRLPKSFIKLSKYCDPLHTLLEHVAEVSTETPICVFGMPLICITQRTYGIGSDMILVHDDDLARIRGINQSGELMDHLQSSKPEIQQVLCGQYLPTSLLSRILMVKTSAEQISRRMKATVRRPLSQWQCFRSFKKASSFPKPRLSVPLTLMI